MYELWEKCGKVRESVYTVMWAYHKSPNMKEGGIYARPFHLLMNAERRIQKAQYGIADTREFERIQREKSRDRYSG